MEYQSETISVKELQKILSNIHISTLIIYLSHCRFAKYKSTPFSGAKARYYLNNDFLDLLYTLLLNRRRYEAAENLQNHFKDVKCLDWGDFICKS